VLDEPPDVTFVEILLSSDALKVVLEGSISGLKVVLVNSLSLKDVVLTGAAGCWLDEAACI
jgi:hypothetical protein